MFRQHHRHIRGAIALALALGLYTAPAACAAVARSPQPVAKDTGAIAASQSQGSPVVRPNPDEQFPWYRAQSPTIVRQANPVVRPNPDEQFPWNRAQSPTIVRVAASDGVAAPAGGFRWGDAGVGAGGVLVLLGLGLAASLAAIYGRRRHTREQRAIGTN